jgi:hypothetical protein
MNAKKLSGPGEAFGELWEIVQIGRQNGLPALFLNGLDEQDNRKLIIRRNSEVSSVVHRSRMRCTSFLLICLGQRWSLPPTMTL